MDVGAFEGCSSPPVFEVRVARRDSGVISKRIAKIDGKRKLPNHAKPVMAELFTVTKLLTGLLQKVNDPEEGSLAALDTTTTELCERSD